MNAMRRLLEVAQIAAEDFARNTFPNNSTLRVRKN
jgi:hypothetical protein